MNTSALALIVVEILLKLPALQRLEALKDCNG